MPTRGRIAAVSTNAVRTMGKGLGLEPFDRMVLAMIRHPEWLFRGRGRVPRAPFEFAPPRPVTDDDRALCRRLIDAFALATGGAGDAVATTGVWAWIFAERQRRLAEALQRRDVEAVAAMLAAMFRSDFVVGMAHGELVGDARPRLGTRLWSLKALDGLVSLGEALGAVPVENPEQGEVGAAFESGLDGLVAAIERELSFPIGFPDVGAPYGARAGTALVPLDWPEQIYAARRLADAMDRHVAGAGGGGEAVVEIGAGYGGMAYALLGLRPGVARYTIVDLPIVGVLQGYFLSTALGAEEVSVFGEPAARVSIVPNSALDTVATPCDVVVNKDSMPEMPEAAMEEYLTWAKGACRHLFFSYNQEARAPFAGDRQNVVPAAVAALGGFTRLRRDASWVRRGYVEEIYVPAAARA
jgi:hypothetical protein